MIWPFSPCGQLRLDRREDVAHALDDVEQVGGRRHLDADIDRLLAVEAHLGFVVVGAQGDVGDVAQAHDRAVLLLQHEVAEFLERAQRRRGFQRDLDHLALGRAEARDVVVVGQRLRYVGGGEAVGRELLRVEPGAQREVLGAQKLGGLHALDRLQLGLHDAHQVVGDLVGRQLLAVEADVHRIDGLADLHGQHRLLRAGGQPVQHRAHLGVDLGQRLARIVVQPR